MSRWPPIAMEAADRRNRRRRMGDLAHLLNGWQGSALGLPPGGRAIVAKGLQSLDSVAPYLLAPPGGRTKASPAPAARGFVVARERGAEGYMSEDRQECAAPDPHAREIDYAPMTRRSGRRIPLAVRLFIEAVCAVGAVSSFEAAYSFYLELSTRRAIPASRMPLYGPAVGCGIFSIGLGRALFRGDTARVWDRWAKACLLAGVTATLVGMSLEGVWR